MFSPISQSSVSCVGSALDKSCAQDAQNDPFNVQWLAKHFNFNPEDVEKAYFDKNVQIMFEVHFKKGKEAIAKNFFDVLDQRKCHPQCYEFNNSVHLNRCKRQAILSAGLNELQAAQTPEEPHPSQTQEFPPFNAQWLEPATPTQQDHLSPKESLSPFDPVWLRDNYHLNLDSIKSFKKIPLAGIEIHFKQDHSLSINFFLAILINSGCQPTYYKLDHSIGIGEMQKDQLLAGTALAKNFVPPIRDESDIDSALKNAILIINPFIEILPIARVEHKDVMKEQSPTRSYVGIKRDSHNYAKILEFIDQIRHHVHFLRETLSHPEYKKKLEYYFILDGIGIIPKLEHFLSNKDPERLYSALLDVFR